MANPLYIKDGQGTLQTFASTTLDSKVVPYHAISNIEGQAVADLQNTLNDISSSLANLEATTTVAKATSYNTTGYAYNASELTAGSPISADSSRKNLIISNQTNAKLLVAFGPTASPTSFVHMVDATAYYEAAAVDVGLQHAIILSGSATSGRVQITTTS